MPRSQRLNQQMREASRRRILRTALRLFATHGYAATSMRMIADKAGISVGLFYNYFPSKADVLKALFAASMADVQASFERADSAATPEQRIEHLILAAFEIVEQHRDFWRFSYGVRMQPSVVRGLGSALREWTASIEATLARYLSDAGAARPEIMASVLFAMIDGACQHYVLDPQQYPAADVAEEMIRVVKRGIARG